VLTYNTETDTLLRLIPASMKSFSSTILDNIEDNEFFKQIKQATINEAKRLMYVGMTRPKEQLILTTYGSKDGDDWLKAIGCDSIDSHAKASVVNWGGAIWNHSVVNYVAPDGDDITSDDVVSFNVLKLQEGHRSFSPKFISPSKAKADKQLYDVEQYATFAERISATATDGRDSTIGDFIHHVMCLWNGDKSIIGKLAQTYGVKVDVEAVASSITNFWNWLEKTYGKAISTERELPFSFTNDLGQIVTGEIDLVYHTAEGDVLVDYKTYQGRVANITDMDSDFYAGKYGGQLALYEEALKHSGCIVRERLVCYLSLGVVVKIE
jgi:ATP-dependent exoDNAse (exonuclease V) beta subunit